MLWEGTHVKNCAKDKICTQCAKKNAHCKISLCPTLFLNHDSSSGLSCIEDTAEPNDYFINCKIINICQRLGVQPSHPRSVCAYSLHLNPPSVKPGYGLFVKVDLQMIDLLDT